jgi:hypothetical protein
MNENGVAPDEQEVMELEEMDDQMLQVIAVRSFYILSQRWERDMTDLVWDCYMELREEADEAAAT